jgi:hypothetical protein
MGFVVEATGTGFGINCSRQALRGPAPSVHAKVRLSGAQAAADKAAESYRDLGMTFTVESED